MTDLQATDPPDWTKEDARDAVKAWLHAVVKPEIPSIYDLAHRLSRNSDMVFSWFSWQRRKTPPPDDLDAIAVLVGVVPTLRVLSATRFLFPEDQPPDLSASDQILAGPLTCLADLGQWITHARKRRAAGKLTQSQLGDEIGCSGVTVSKWENPDARFSPKPEVLERIAEVCGFPIPEISFELRPGKKGRPQVYVPPKASSLREEIQYTATALASRCFSGAMLTRNAAMLMDRFGLSGAENATLQAIGDKFGLTRERVRQTESRMMKALETTSFRTDAFDALEQALVDFTPGVLSEVEATLRPLLGEGVGLEGAIEYGNTILGRCLPVEITRRADGEPLVMKGAVPNWYTTALYQCRTLIRHNGAALPNLLWAMTMRATGEVIPYEDFVSVISHFPGYQALDESEWFWLGPDGAANRVVDRAISILQHSLGSVDIEIIYGGIVRLDRSRESNVAPQAAAWPPMSVVNRILSNHPAFACKQYNDFSLAQPLSPADPSEQSAAEVIVQFMLKTDGIASRKEIYEHIAQDGRHQPITVGVALGTSPLITTVDRGVYAIRGWPLSAARLEEAQRQVGGAMSYRPIEIEGGGLVSWEHVLTEGAMRNYAASVPAKAKDVVPAGRYRVSDDHHITIVEDRVGGLVPHLIRMGAQPGWSYRISFDVPNESATVETWEPVSEDATS